VSGAARIFPGFNHCVAHEPVLKELHRTEARRAAWVRWGKIGKEPTVDMRRLIADQEAYGHGQDASDLRGFVERGNQW
jgi:hypothetical protein